MSAPLPDRREHIHQHSCNICRSRVRARRPARKAPQHRGRALPAPIPDRDKLHDRGEIPDFGRSPSCMPASIVIVHNDHMFLESRATALRAAGHSVATFDDPMAAMDALETASRVEVLVTRGTFPTGKPNGVSLALVTRTKRPLLKVVFAARPGLERFAEDIGEVVPPEDEAKVVEAVTRALDEARWIPPQREA